ncbi:class E sortase [Microbacterium sp. W1N]|uniref:class E sortase n=1 Tax=Microbacterium festucae TaxID=2977531 RepID=UPI0021BF202F|nr:class E sortase [Microbacterium festucae]MCT9819452.1 class E sortase [Microbacterium festucae]
MADAPQAAPETAASDAPSRRDRRRGRPSPRSGGPAPRRRVSVVGVIGELLITVGVVALLYVAWQMWIGDWIIGSQKTAEATALSQSWAQEPTTAPATPSPDASATPQPDETGAAEVPVPVLAEPAHGDQFGVMHVPRFGPTWQFTIASGVTRKDILDQGEVGHYPDTQMPGELGNTVYAAHRWTSGAPFDPIDRLVVGDAIVVETQDGWYTYRFRTLEYVQDTQVDVLAPVPQEVGTSPDGRYLTLTSCAPKFNMLERIIAYAMFESFTPRTDGPPASLTEGAA